MIRAYDDNGNVVDLVKWETKIKREVCADIWNLSIEKYDEVLSLSDLNEIIKKVEGREAMPNSLRCQIKKLAHEGKITEEELNDLILKLDGHDKQIRKDTIDEFKSKLISDEFQRYALDDMFETCRMYDYSQCIDVFIEYVEAIAGQLKGGAK